MPHCVKCPCLNCQFIICDKHESPLHRSDDQLVADLKNHILKHHTIGELEELLGRVVVEYLERELGRKLEG